MIVKHFTELVHEMKGVNSMLDVFAHFAGFDEHVKAYFKTLISSKKKSSNVKERLPVAEAFLCKIIDMSKNEVSEEVCLLEEEIRKTEDGKMLLKRILEKPSKTKGI